MPSLLDRLQEALAPDYMVEGTIASGGMGTVFLGRDQRLNRPVAIKTLRQEIATAVAVQRFIQEAQHLARLNHPNVVRVHDAGEAGDLVYYVMDYVEGETLDTRIKRSPLSLTETQELGRELLSALALAHRNGIVHRDIKPSNIFLSDGRSMLADFGIAHTLDKSTALTQTGQLIGTPAYMAPEQFAGGTITPRTDLYAVGLVLFEAYGRGDPDATFVDLGTVPWLCNGVKQCRKKIDWLTNNKASGRRNANPHWSPDGRDYVFTDRANIDTEDVQIWTTEYGTDERLEISTSQRFDYRPDWGRG